MIYIDPPYNTGHDFLYKDKFRMDEGDYAAQTELFDEEGNRQYIKPEPNTSANGQFHSVWCSMMYPLLILARNLLTDDGVMFISIDDNEADNLLKIGQEVFGEINFITQIPWQTRQSIQNDTDLSINHEYIIVFAKRRRLLNRRLKESNIKEWFNHDSFAFLPMPVKKDNFANPDNDPRGLWKADPMDAPNVRPNLTYSITNPNTGKSYMPPNGRCWRFSPEKFKELFADNRVVWSKNGNGRPQLKVFYEEKKFFGSIDNSWWTGERFGTATQGTKEVMSLFNQQAIFDTPKPVKLLHNMIKLVSRPEDNDIILDFFSGSATTAHAVMELNAEDGGHRKFIMVQLPEACDAKSEAYKAGYRTICDIGEERIRRAGKKIRQEHPEAELDTGFRVFRVDSTNMEDVYYSAGDYAQEALAGLTSNIKPDRSALDVFFGCVLDWGLPLDRPYETEEIAGYAVHNYDHGALLACFADAVSEELVRAMAQRRPLRAVFRDSSFPDSPAKINAEEIFKMYSPLTKIKVI